VRDVLDDLVRWWEAGHSVGLATVVGTSRSAPRPPGTSMLVGPAGEAIGSVSGGCVEAAVYDLAVGMASDPGRVPLRERYGISDDDAFSAGLTCGGIIDVYVERVCRDSFPELGAVAASIHSGTPVAVVTCVDPADSVRYGRRMVVWDDRAAGSFGSARLDAAVADDARGMLAAGQTATLHYGPDGERQGDELALFVATYAPPPRMIVFGAIDFAAAAARVGSFLGFHVTVCDARPVFATARRFPDADQVVVDWPHRYLSTEAAAGRIDERTVLCVLTHDPKFDVPLLEVALRLPVAYIGAMGSRRTHADRLERLREAGLTDAELARLRSPIGLDLGARTPEETAVSIAAEIIAARWGGSATVLSIVDGPIHRAPPLGGFGCLTNARLAEPEV
jgi:xanthine dehydrogenase accessory factor